MRFGLDHTLEELDGLGVSSQSDDCLLVLGALADRISAGALDLALHADGVDLGDLDAEDLLDRVLDLDLAGILGDLEDILLVCDGGHGAFGNDRTNDDIVNVSHYANTSSITARASLSMTRVLALSRS